MTRAVVLVGLLLLAGCGRSDPPAPPTDPAALGQIERDVEKARQGEGKARPKAKAEPGG